MQDLTIILAQADLVWEDAAANRALFTQMLADAPAADLLLLPEMWSTGFSMQAARLAEPMDGPSVQWMQTLAQQRQALVVGSLIIQAGGRYYNRCLAAQPDGSLAHYDKRHLFRLAREEATYTAGAQNIIITHKGWRILPQVCYDLRFAVWSRNQLGWGPLAYDLLLYVANWPTPRSHHWQRLLSARAIENLCYLAALNRVGTDGKGHSYDGHSVVLDMHGTAVAQLPAGQAGLLHATLSASALQQHREKFAFYQDADRFQVLSTIEENL